MNRFLPDKMPALLISLLLVAGGCAVKTRNITYYAFDYPSPPIESESPVKDPLMVYRFLQARSLSLDSLVISQDKEGEQTLFKYRWEENPADMITDLVLRDLQSSGLFDKVVDQLSSVRYRFALEGNIKKLQGTVKDGKAQAMLEMECSLTDFDAPSGQDKTVLRKNYQIEVPSKDTTPESIIKAMNSAVKELSRRLRTDIRLSLERSGALEGPGPDGQYSPQETKVAEISVR